MNTKGKRNNRKKNKGGQQANKGGESDGWEEMLKKPLPEEDNAGMGSSLQMA